MALILKDRVQETTTSTGTTAITLGGAVTGYQTFSSAIGNGNTCYYTIALSAEWEVGIGTYTASGNTLSRDTVLESSNAGSLVSFSAGTKNVFVTYPAEKAVTLDGTLPATAGGTGTSTYATGDILYASAANTLSKLTAGTNGQVLTLASGVPSWAATNAATTRTVSNFTATASQTTFTVSYTVGLIDVYRNGVKLPASDYTATNGTSVVLTTAANLDDIIETVAYSALSIGTGVNSFSGGTTGLTPASGTGNVTLAGTLNVANGGTGVTTSTGTGSVALSASPTFTGTLNAATITTTGTISDSKGDVRAAPINSKTAAYVLIATDSGKTISITTGGVTVNASIFSAGDMVSIFNNSGSNQTITQGTSVTLRLSGTATTGNRTLAQYGVATLLCVVGGATPTFACTGAGLT